MKRMKRSDTVCNWRVLIMDQQLGFHLSDVAALGDSEGFTQSGHPDSVVYHPLALTYCVKLFRLITLRCRCHIFWHTLSNFWRFRIFAFDVRHKNAASSHDYHIRIAGMCARVCVCVFKGFARHHSLWIKGVGKLVQIYCLRQLCQIWQAQMVSLQMAGRYLRVNSLCNTQKSCTCVCLKSLST